MGKGQITHFTLSYGIFQVNWKSKITRYEPYTFFENTALEGPFKKWVHQHSFERHGRKTLIQDEIIYEFGLGPLGKLMDRLIIGYQIENFLKERQKKTTEKIKQIKSRSA
jgi:ligand-binding SRPBCC domain-containing protein